MALALRQEAAATAAEIITALETAHHLPETALRLAVERADEIAPAVIALVEQAADGVYLLPRQENLLFWGVHALAAGRRTELYPAAHAAAATSHGRPASIGCSATA